MNRITEITKRDIFELFKNGLEIEDYFENRIVVYHYFGRLEEIEFLRRLYDLKNMPSYDSRFPNAERDIWQHTINNDDFSSCWVFEDERFELKNGKDETYLKFLCEIFHPAVRYEKGYWKEYLEKINIFLRNDGYEIYPTHKISNRDVYGWRTYENDSSALFVPYSQRNKKDIKEKRIVLSIKKSARNQIYELLNRFDIVYQEMSETGFYYNTSISESFFKEIKQFYIPKCYNEKKEYVETNNLKQFITSNSPFFVLDAIEMFSRLCADKNYEPQVNALLKLNELPLQLSNGKIIHIIDEQLNSNSLSNVQEAGLKELLQEATKLYSNGNLQFATEKLWDAFERLKTYYCSNNIDKKTSVKKLITNMSDNQNEFYELFNEEFLKLTSIGNDFRIRHHETTKIDISDRKYYEYFYRRCLSLISIAINYLDEKII